MPADAAYGVDRKVPGLLAPERLSVPQLCAPQHAGIKTYDDGVVTAGGYMGDLFRSDGWT